MENLSTEREALVLSKQTPTKKGNVQKLRKINRNAGKEYCTQNGKIRPAKVFQNKDCRCSKGCIKLLSPEKRKKIFDGFWTLGDFNKQNLFLYDTIKRESVKRQRLRNGRGAPRAFSFKYFLTTDNEKFAVCKRFFLDTFNVSEGRLQRTLRSEKPGCDMRGRASGSRRKVPEEERKSVLDHIKSFPCYPGFLNNIKFLHPELNIRKMYNLYLVKCIESNTKPANEVTYRKIFKKDFSLYTHQPRDDACQECCKLNVKFKSSNDDKEKSDLMREHDAHLKEADLVRKSFQRDQNLASNNPDLYFVFSFDLQKPLPCPRLTTSDAYYKNSLFISNFSCHNFHDKKVFMYLWDETIASRGSKELASCILKHVKNLRNEKRIIAYSNVDTGIKRSITVALTWLKIIQSPEHEVDIIDHKFLSSGHTALPNEEDFEFAESTLRKSSLFVPQECYEALRKSKKNNVTVNEMKQEDFVSTKPLKDAVFRRLNNTDGERVDWLEISWMRFLKSEPYKMFYKTSAEADFRALDLQPPLGEPRNFNKIQLPPVYEKKRPIAKLKYDDLMDLLAHVPPAHHNYFKSLSHMQNEE